MSDSVKPLNGHALTAPDGVEIKGHLSADTTEILSYPALEFLAAMTREFRARRKQLLELRAQKWQAIQNGAALDFDADTKAIREGDWKVSAIPAELQDRRVEITGPVDRKMVINALNSGAKVFMADFEDASSPTWANMTEGQVNMRDAIHRTIAFTNDKGKDYQLNEDPAVLFVRPRGWHLDEKHLLVDGAPIPGGFMDFGLYFFHNIRHAQSRDSSCYFYLPKTESYQETALWNDVFAWSEERLGIKHGSIKVTVLVETITASFQLHEILHSLKDYIVALNCGRWDYIFSYIKMFHKNPNFLLPDRAQVTMATHFMRSYSQLVIKTCHARGAMAMGGMAAAIPVKNDKATNDRAVKAVKADKEREASDGHDGTWVAHPALVPVALEVFDRLMPQANQMDNLREDVSVTAADLLRVPDSGEVTEKGLRLNISVAIQYIAAWLTGRGAVPINNLMEDAATAEISRAQLWQCVHHTAELADGRVVTLDLFNLLLQEEMEKLQESIPADQFEHGRYRRAATLLDDLVNNERFEEFLTLSGYELLD